ncbi:MAG: hypothetical protein ABW051_05350, partial [Burkholderiaceae bacterium]
MAISPAARGSYPSSTRTEAAAVKDSGAAAPKHSLEDVRQQLAALHDPRLAEVRRRIEFMLDHRGAELDLAALGKEVASLPQGFMKKLGDACSENNWCPCRLIHPRQAHAIEPWVTSFKGTAELFVHGYLGDCMDVSSLPGLELLDVGTLPVSLSLLVLTSPG